MKIGLNQSRILYQYLFSFAIVLLIPLVFFIGMINNRIFPAFQDQIIRANQENLERAREQIDQKVDEMEKIALNISENQRLSTYMIRKNFYKAYEGISELRSYKYANDFIYDILYYIRADDRIYTAYQSWNLDLMIEKIYRFENWDYTELYKDINSMHTPTIKPVDRLTGSMVENLEIVPYMYPIKPYDPYATVIFLIDNKKFKEILNSVLKEYNENVYVLDQNRQIVTSLNRQDMLNNEELDYIIQRIDDQDTFMLPGHEYLVSSVRSNRNSWTFISVVRNNMIMAKVDDMKREVYSSISMIFIGGALIIILAVYINYTPLYRLQKKITSRLSIKAGGKNEVESMGRIFDEILAANEALKQDIERYKPMLREYVLKGLIQGNTREMDDTLELRKELQLSSAQKASYQVVIFKFFDKVHQWNHVLGCKYIHKLLESQLRHDIKVYSIDNYEKDNLIEVISFHGDIEQDRMEDVKLVLQRVISRFSSEWGMNIVVGVGNLYDDILALGQSFTEASRALQFYAVEKEITLYIFDELDITSFYQKEEYAYPYDDLKKLSIQMNLGNMENIKETLEKVLNVLSAKDIPQFFAQCIVFDIYNMLIKKAMEMNINLQRIAGNYMEAFSSNNLENLEGLKGLLNSACQEICNRIIQQQDVDNELLTQITEYIEKNYALYEFSLDRMAQHFDITPTYLSYVFKQKTGETISEYLWNLRLKRAKKLLIESNLPIKDIVEQVGYVNVSSFGRKFRDSEGVPPGEYRKRNKVILG